MSCKLHFEYDGSSIPDTQSSIVGSLPRSYLTLYANTDSLIWTIFPGPPDELDHEEAQASLPVWVGRSEVSNFFTAF